jgi:hypothetical protein
MLKKNKEAIASPSAKTINPNLMTAAPHTALKIMPVRPITRPMIALKTLITTEMTSIMNKFTIIFHKTGVA